MANALLGHLQCMDERPRRLQNQPAPSHSGITQSVVAYNLALFARLKPT